MAISNDGRSGINVTLKGAKGDYYGEGITEFTHKLEMLSARLKNPQPALREAEMLFALMEAEIFQFNGSSPTFGVFNTWRPLAQSTLDKLGPAFANKKPLVGPTGALKRAAENPEFFPIGTKAINIIIDPRKHQTATGNYSNGNNYAYFHQYGIGNNPLRRIIPHPAPPLFIAAVRRVIARYVFEDELIETPHERRADAIVTKVKESSNVEHFHHHGSHNPINERRSVEVEQPRGGFAYRLGRATGKAITNISTVAKKAVSKFKFFGK